MTEPPDSTTAGPSPTAGKAASSAASDAVGDPASDAAALLACTQPLASDDGSPSGAALARSGAGAQSHPWGGHEGKSLKRFRARWLALLAATGIALYLCWLMLDPFVEVLLWATVLAMVFYPVHRWILARTHRPGWAAVLSCVVVVAAIVIPVGLVALAVVNEAQNTAAYVQKNADQLLSPDSKLFKWMGRYVVDLDQIKAPLPDLVAGPAAPMSATTRPTAGLRDYLVDRLRDMSGTIAQGTFIVVGQILLTVLKIVFVILTLYYLFRDGDRIKQALLDGLPLDRPQTQRIFDRTSEVIGASVYGVLVIASIQAVLGEIGFLAVGLPSPLLWGVVLFFLSMIPMAGSFLVWVPACIFLLLDGHWIRAIILAGWCIGIVGMIDNVFRPRLVGKRTRLHELLVFFSVLGGLKVFGALGLVVGPVVVAITLALVDVFRKADRASSPGEPTLAERQAMLRNVEDPPRRVPKPVTAKVGAAAAIGPALSGGAASDKSPPADSGNGKRKKRGRRGRNG